MLQGIRTAPRFLLEYGETEKTLPGCLIEYSCRKERKIMRVLVTGANGFLGRGIVKELLNMGYDVAAAGHDVSKVDDRATLYPCDIFEVQDPWNAFGKPDILLHLAWRDGFKHYSDAHIEDLPRHYLFLKSFADSGLQTIAVMSSMHEVGRFEGMITEDSPCNPITPYGISKNALKELTRMLCCQNDKVFLWLRGYYVVKNDADGSSLFSKIIQAEKQGMKTFPFTDGEARLDFQDYEKYCRYTALAAVQNQVTGVIEICSGHPEKLADRVERFIKENKLHIRPEYGAFPNRPYDNSLVWGDSKKMERILKNEKTGDKKDRL